MSSISIIKIILIIKIFTYNKELKIIHIIKIVIIRKRKHNTYDKISLKHQLRVAL